MIEHRRKASERRCGGHVALAALAPYPSAEVVKIDHWLIGLMVCPLASSM